jgi:hypothetical protein
MDPLSQSDEFTPHPPVHISLISILILVLSCHPRLDLTSRLFWSVSHCIFCVYFSYLSVYPACAIRVFVAGVYRANNQITSLAKDEVLFIEEHVFVKLPRHEAINSVVFCIL